MSIGLRCLLPAALVFCLSCTDGGDQSKSADVGSDKSPWPRQDVRGQEVRRPTDVAENDAAETSACVDNDGDGYGIDCPKGPDCNDAVKTCHVDCETDADQNGVPDCEESDCPGTEEIPYNGVDDDCDPFTSDADVDKDGYEAFAMGGGDCDDENPQVHPEAQEVCGDWLDNNCDGFPIPGSNQPECPQGQMCNLINGQCEDDPDCNGCPMGQVCQGGKCEVDETCYGGCPEKQKCIPESGLCVVVGCLEEGCPEDGKSWACNPYTGYCYITSCDESCPKGKVCNPETGLCDVDQDCGGQCLMNETCDQNTGTCGPTPNCPNDFCWGWPEGMWRVEGPDTLYYIDQYEWPNHIGQLPSANILSPAKAQDMCFSVGKRPCTVEELSAACDGAVGPEGSELPYAQTAQSGYVSGTCNAKSSGVEESGSHPACKNEAFAVWDLVGNLAEWTQEGVLFGGYYDDGMKATCAYTVSADSVPLEAMGFRCCISPTDDLDGDGFTAAEECDESNPSVFPGAEEKCNEVDDNCNGLVDDMLDYDDDGFTICEGDCDDTSPERHPDAEDPVGGIFDQNCDGVDGVDADGDGQASVESGGGDCNDTPETGSDTWAGAPDEFGDGIDQNCDEFDGIDSDGDKHAGNAPIESPSFDCNDGDVSVYVGAPDTVGDQKDQNCDGIDGVDADDDGQASVDSGGEDCDDANNGVFADCAGKDCGDDGCGGSCGNCWGCGETCVGVVCVFTACDNKECGSDGCGGSCDSCPAGKSCVAGQCEVVCGDEQCHATETQCSCYGDCGTCAGCCVGMMCKAGTSSTYCGKNGENCTTCDADQYCKDQECIPKTWFDATSGLTWQVEPTGGEMSWSDAIAHCAGLPLAGGGWHLPTIEELRSLIRGCPGTATGGACGVTDDCLSMSCNDEGGCWDCSNYNGPADGCYWPDEMQGTCVDNPDYWSSSAVADNDLGAWAVYFHKGGVQATGVYLDWHIGSARCVR